MASVNNNTSAYDPYDGEWTTIQEKHERNLAKAKEDEEKTLAAAKQEYQEKLKSMREEANEEVRKLKEETYDSHGRRFVNMEKDHLHERNRLKDSYENALKKSDEFRQNQEKNYEQRLESAMSEANERTQSQVKTQKGEFVRLAETKKQEADQAKKYYLNEIEREKSKAIKSTEQVVRENDQLREKAVKDRSAKYEEYIKENRQQTKAELNAKNQEIAALKSNNDPTKVSPTVKTKIEEAYRKQIGKDITEERRVNEANMQALKNTNQNFQQKVRDGYSEKFSEMSNDLRQRHMVEKQGLVRGYEDLESQSESTQKRMMDRQTDLSERTYKKHANDVSLQEQRNQERIKEQRAVLLDEKNKEKDIAESKLRTQEREWNYKLTDVRRNYEKKFLDQKDEHEKQMSQVKFEFDKKLQEQRRSSKSLLDERVNALETQIKQQEITFKEHERLLTEHYEEELDRMKRTNARITQAKS